MKRRIAALVQLWGAEDLVRDAHRYGGGLMASIGLAAYLDSPALMPLTLGVLLLYLGIRRS